MAIINGTAGDDTLLGTPYDDEIYGFDGQDLIRGFEGNDLIDGGNGHDFMRGNEGNDTILGGADDDYLDGGEGDDLLDGASGWDRVTYAPSATAGVIVDLNIQGVSQNTGQGVDTLIGIEHLSGTAFNDVLTGDGGDNWLWGGSNGTGATGDDSITAGSGNDLVQVGTGNHSLSGGIGADTLTLHGNGTDITAAGVTVSLLLQGAAQDTEQGMMNLSGFENLSGSPFDDHLTGDGNNNVLAGQLGNDTLVGGAGFDTLYGDGQITVDTHDTGGSGPIVTYADASLLPFADPPGNDMLEGGLGNDTLDGGGGSDTASYVNAAGSVSVNLATGFASGADGFDTLTNIENATGSAHDDFLRGDAGDNVLDGGDGNDNIRGEDGHDTLIGGAGHDFMRGGLGNDSLSGGADDDYMDGGLGDDAFDGGSGWDRISYAVDAAVGVTVDLNIVGIAQATGHGNDTITGVEHLSGTKFDDNLTGDGGDNWLWGGSDNSGVTGNDTINAGGGNDLVWVGAGNHVASGGLGTDTLGIGNDADVTAAGVTLSLALQGAAQPTGQGNWNLSGFENLSGSGHDDRLTGDAAANLIAGGLGDDELSGGANNDTLLGDGAVTVDTHGMGGSGPIVTHTDVQLLDPMFLVSGNDLLEGGDGDDIINGGGGSDTAAYTTATGAVQVNLIAGNSTGAAGNDTLIGIENFTGSAYNDFARGNGGDNVLAGGDGHDFMRGHAGNDTMIGGNDDDYLDGAEGDDILDGGAGWDRATYAPSATAGVTVDLNIDGVAQATGQGNDTLIGIEHVSGTAFDDILIGDAGDNWVWGGSNATGVTGNDNLSAGGGNDLVQVGTGNHTLAGGTGTDTLMMHGNGTDITAAGVTVSLLLQGAAQATEQGNMLLTGFENLSGSTFDDFLTGDNGDNLLAGDSGADNLSGGSGADTLYGDGRVTVDHHNTGGSGPIVTIEDVGTLEFPDPTGNDVLDGGKGNDTLVGGGGDDTLTGGLGNDTFVAGDGTGDDHVTDFKNGDTILIQGAGVDDFSDLTIVNSGGNAVISWGTSDSVTVDGYKAKQLKASDFDFDPPSFAAFAQMESASDLSAPLGADYWAMRAG